MVSGEHARSRANPHSLGGKLQLVGQRRGADALWQRAAACRAVAGRVGGLVVEIEGVTPSKTLVAKVSTCWVVR